MAQPQRGPVRTEVSDLRNIVDRLDLLMGASTDASGDAGESLPGTVREQIERTLSDLTERVAGVERETEELRTLVNHLMTIATWQAKVTATLVGDEGEPEADEASHAQQQPRHEAADEPPDDAQHALYSGAAPPPSERDYGDAADRHGGDLRPREYGDAADRHGGDLRPREYGDPGGRHGGDLRSRDYGDPGPGNHAGDHGPKGFVDRVGQHVDARRGDEPERSRRQAPSTLDDDIDDILGTDREPSSEMGPPPDFGI